MATAALDTPVGQLVVERPSRPRVFEKYGIDYCCGGKLSLVRACEKRKVDPAELLQAITVFDEAIPVETDWTRVPLADLIDNIVNVHHAYLQVHHPDRLIHPLIKENGRFRKAGWKEALDLIERCLRKFRRNAIRTPSGCWTGRA